MTWGWWRTWRQLEEVFPVAPYRGQVNRALWFTNGPYPEPNWPEGIEHWGPRPRSRFPWAVLALSQARRRHHEKFGEFPHTVYLDSETYERLFLDIAMESDRIMFFPPGDRIVFGMKVELER